MAELKPCPFCGRTPKIEDCGDNRYFVKCKCGIEQSGLYWQKCDAVRHWNRRKEQTEQMPDYIDNVLVVRHYCNGMVAMNEECYKRMQSVDPITTEQAIEHLQECGWLPEHDRILTETKCGEWISCKEKLPKNDDWKIITIRDESGDSPYIYSDFGWYFDRAECWIVDAEQRNDVIAWMPLPLPYGERKESE